MAGIHLSGGEYAVRIGFGAGAKLAEFSYRVMFAGFYGTLTRSFRQVQPKWKGLKAAVETLWQW